MTNAPLSKPGSGSVPQYSRTQHKSDRRQARTYDGPRKHCPCLAVSRLAVRRTQGRVQHASAISTGKSIIYLPCSAARLTAQSETERSLSAVVYSLDDTTVGRAADTTRNKYVQKLWVRTYVQCRLGRVKERCTAFLVRAYQMTTRPAETSCRPKGCAYGFTLSSSD